MQTIYRSDGIGGLYQGVGISLLSNFLYRGLYFGAFDSGKDMIPNYQQQTFFVKF